MTPSLTPWHKVISLLLDLRSGELSLAAFAADCMPVLVSLVPAGSKERS
jgi:hypothetical protein